VRAIMNQCTQMSCRIEFKGREITGLAPREIAALGIGYVPQTNNVFASLSVQENLEMSCYLLPRGEHKDQIESAYTRFPALKERRHQAGSSLSGGERQMLAVSSALLSKPDLIILDEPVSGLSPSITNEVVEGIAAINRSGVSVLWVVEENPRKIICVADEVVVFSSGTVRLHQPAEELLAADNFRELFLGV
jgi:ABC-type branched-subunit amino acid transport system ATPase component